ncbi:uncharacterized protein LOC110769929 [Prunus avium]|uniref:Uncharacterized protein LOC110769929 n=1 Tax=Prunus avium TaxID=42229 RepID=A0A6P5TRC1_PRUAV|nr:uncharacterized protein LOC110769929 [Prunus avium]
MLGSVAAAGAWIRKFKEYYVELQSLREKKVHQERNLNGKLQSLMELEVRLERLTEKHIAEDIQFKAMLLALEKLVRVDEQLEERTDRVRKRLKDLMNEQEKEKENPMEK